jgi:hypothetical protein
MERDTVGKISTELIAKSDDKHTVIDQMHEQLSEYDQTLHDTVELGKKTYPDDFYVVVLTKKERLMENVIRNYFIPRGSCPTPEWDQAVYRYHKPADRVGFLWIVPSRDTCSYMRNNANVLPKEQYELLTYVLQFEDGTLLKLSKQLNGEHVDSPFVF